MDYFIPRHMKGFAATDEQREAARKAGRDPDRVGTPYQVFRGIHHIPDALANSKDANRLGIKPVEEMTGDEWRQIGLDRDTWMAANRPKAKPKADEGAASAAETTDAPPVSEEDASKTSEAPSSTSG